MTTTCKYCGETFVTISSKRRACFSASCRRKKLSANYKSDEVYRKYKRDIEGYTKEKDFRVFDKNIMNNNIRAIFTHLDLTPKQMSIESGLNEQTIRTLFYNNGTLTLPIFLRIIDYYNTKGLNLTYEEILWNNLNY